MVPPEDEPEPESTTTVHVDADSLEYTRTGLRTRQEIPLKVGRHNRVVIVRPPRQPTIGDGHGGFPVGEAFPLTATLSVLWLYGPETSAFAHSRGEAEAPLGVFQVYGHADAIGSEADNKILSERRAEVARALLVGDVDALAAVAEEEGWGSAHEQVLLRVLGCDPGPIDGDHGPLTEAAVESFQSRYVEGEFHRHPLAPASRNPALKVDGKLGPNTRAALLEALVTTASPFIGNDALHPAHPAPGCSHYNLASVTEEPTNRRVSLVVHSAVPKYSEDAPCRAGDEQACAVVDDAQHRCMWFREHVAERPPAPPRFYDPRWLDLGNGKYLLSALTTVPEGQEVEFQVYSATTPVDGRLLDPSVLRDEMGPSRMATSYLGVAQVVWSAPADFAPGDDGRIADPNGQRVAPTFRVLHHPSGAHTYDSWPATDVAVLFDRRAAEAPYFAHPDTRLDLVAEDVGYRGSQPATAATPHDEDHFIVRFEGAPREGRYSLVVFYGEGSSRVLFENVAFDALDDCGPKHDLPVQPAEDPPQDPPETPDPEADDPPLDPTADRADWWMH